MTRVSKEPEVRRREILDAALALFARRGYTATTVNDLLDAVSIAKGTFYYHFASKADVMRALIVDIVEAGVARARAIAADRTRGVPDRIIAIMAAQDAGSEYAAMTPSLHEAGSAEFHLLSYTALLEKLTPVLADVVREGIAEGVLDTPFPEESVAMLISATMLADEGFDGTPEDRQRTIAALLLGAERLLGAAPGTFLERAATLGAGR